MQLPEAETELFFKLFQHLLVFANDQKKVHSPLKTREKLLDLDINDIAEIRDVLFQNITLIDEFVDKNPFEFPEKELSHVLKWKNFKMGRFMIMTFLKDCTVFLSQDEGDAKPYGVLSLNTRFDEMLDKSQLPFMMEVNLLPFKDQIVTDGLFHSYNVSFGGNMIRNMKQDYQEAKAKYGIIKSFNEPKKSKIQQQEDTLKMYLKTEKNREYYKEEIEELLEKYPELQKIYIQERGQKNATRQKKYLELQGFSGAYFAVFGESVIASATDKKKLEKRIEEIVPKEKRDWVISFSLKK